MEQKDFITEDEFNPYVFFDFLNKNVLGGDSYVSIRDFSNGYHLGVVRRTGIEAIEVVLSFLNGDTRVVRKSIKDKDLIIIRGEILFEEQRYAIKSDTKLEDLDDRLKYEVLKILGDLEYAFMGTELEF